MFDGINLDKLKEECGVIGIYHQENVDVSKMVYYGLYALQHRGQESAGIATNDGVRTHQHKAMGRVAEIFSEETFQKLEGNVGIGHVRYSTTGESYVGNAQPLTVFYRRGSIAVAHNGNLVNAELIRNKLEDDGVVFQTTIDTEVLVNLIARYSGDGIENAIERTMGLVKGAYAMTVMTENQLIGVRDPLGLRPLCLGKLKDGYVLASESCALDILGAEFVRDIEPGEIITINQGGVSSKRVNGASKRASCIFEYVYFARPDSIIDGVSVYEARKNAGKFLAKEHPVEADLVIAVPDTSIPAAIGYAQESGIPSEEGLVKNRYVGRTFIQPDQSSREMAVRLKLNPLKSVVSGKTIIVIDDSIVRGTTSKRIVSNLKEAGAKEVHMRVSSPPVAYSCYYGVDTPNRRSLIGSFQSVEDICREIGADSLGYLSTDALVRSTGLGNEHFCLACFNGEYPIDVEKSECSKSFNRLKT